MEALLEAAEAPDYAANIVLVISNRPEAAGLSKAEARGIKAICIDHKKFRTREEFEAELHAALMAYQIEFVACAGFMRVLTEKFVRLWQGRMINIHPSLLPKYKGLHTHQRALDAGDREHGATVHWVSAEVDGGEIIDQIKLKVQTSDTAESLSRRLLPLELELYKSALNKAILEKMHQ